MRLLPYSAKLQGHSAALFSHWMIPVAERWTLTLGGRAERDFVRFTPQGGDSRDASWKRFLAQGCVAIRMDGRRLRLCQRCRDGFRAGSFNTFSPAANYPAYAPEKVRSWEIGLKGGALDRRLLYSVALYTMDIDDMQVQQMLTPGAVYIAKSSRPRAPVAWNYKPTTCWARAGSSRCRGPQPHPLRHVYRCCQ